MAKYNPGIKTYLQKMERKHGKGKGKVILAHKIARAVYFMLKRNTVFDINKLLNNWLKGPGGDTLRLTGSVHGSLKKNPE